jgi:hypothetical protein
MWVISYSVYGPQVYFDGALENIRLARHFYPEFLCRFYTDDPVRAKRLGDEGGEVIVRESPGSALWRFESAEDAEVCLVRDADSRLGPRERAAVDEWLRSECDFHAMHDHPYHQAKIMGGMWGCRNYILPGIAEAARAWPGREYGDDQAFLESWVYPRVKDTLLSHGRTSPFPTARLHPSEYVGLAVGR